MFALSCGGPPDVAIIQSAYERESAIVSKPHDKTLQILQATCHNDGTDKYRCEITFISKSDPTQLQFFGVVGLARVAGDWELMSGLCKS